MKQIFCILFVCLLSLSSHATHIVGGGFALKHITGNSYELTMNYLGDCLNGTQQAFTQDQSDMTVGIFDKATNARKTTVSLAFISKNVLAFATDSCAKTIKACTELFIFRKTITLDPKVYNNTAGYYISWERCCRNNVIANIVNPGGAAMVFYMEFPPVAFISNSSPYFTNNPNTLLCAEGDFTYNLNYKDDDNDQLKFSLTDPLNGNLNSNTPGNNGNPIGGPYKPIQWASGYSANNAILGAPSLSIDANTGQISVTPTVIGVFIASIKVEEFRFGKKIGEVRLELQFTIGNCPNLPPSVITLNDSASNQDVAYFDVQIPKELCFRINSTDTKDSIYLKVSSPIFTNDTITSFPVVDTVSGGYLSINKRFCWKTDCSLRGLGRVPFYLTLKDNGCPSPRSAKKNVYVNIINVPLINQASIICLTLADNKTIVYWADSTGNNPYFKQYNLYRGIDYANWVLVDSIANKNQRSYTDNNTPNNQSINYTYMMRGVNICGLEGPPSDTLSTFEQLVAAPAVQKINYVTVSTDDRSIKINWPQTEERDFAKYYLYRTSKEKTPYKLLKVFEWPNDTSFQDFDVLVDDTSYCYYVIMRDTCDNYSPYGQVSCSILLKGYSENFINTIWWNPYKTWETGVSSYEVWRSDPVTAYQNIVSVDTVKTQYDDSKLNIDEGMFNYFVNAVQSSPITALKPSFTSRSNEIQVRISPIVYAPSAFSANGDDVNDKFKWSAVYTKDMNIKVFNRWGQLIYETNDKKAYWDGTVNGSPAPVDVYHYLIYYTGYDGSSNTISGNLTLLR